MTRGLLLAATCLFAACLKAPPFHGDADGGPGSDGDGALGGPVEQGAYAKAHQPGSTDEFGTAIALSDDGSTLAVGAWQEDGSSTGVDGSVDDGAMDAGAVYIYTASSGVWAFQAYLKSSDTAAIQQFGASVALSSDGNTLAVGAPGQASGEGAVYVFSRSGNSWVGAVQVKPAVVDANDRFGTSVSLSSDGNVLAVGVPFEDGNGVNLTGAPASDGLPDAGAAYVFTRNVTWGSSVYVKASNTGDGDKFGGHVALSGDGATLAVGAIGEDNATGAVYVYEYSSSAWSAQQYLKATSVHTNNNFGSAVALSEDGDLLAIGAVGDSSDATGVGGNDTAGSATKSGAVYVFNRSGVTWSKASYLKASNSQSLDQFGTSVAMSRDGTAILVGAIGEDSAATGIDGLQGEGADSSGAAYLFAKRATWEQRAYVKASNTGVGDYFGGAAAIANDGTFAIGATDEDSDASGIGGNEALNGSSSSGAVYVFNAPP